MENELTKLLGLAPPKRMGLQRPELDAAAAMDPALANDMFQGGMASEIEDRLFQAQRSQNAPGLEPSENATPSTEVDALSNLLGRYKNLRAGSPLQQQQREYDQQRLGNIGAQNEGFLGGSGQSPMQEREIYKRLQAEEVRKQPVQLQSMRDEAAAANQRRQIKATQRNVDTQMGPSQLDARTRAEYQKFLMEQMEKNSGQPAADNYQIKSMGRYGPTFQTPQRQFTPVNPNQITKQLQDARSVLGANPWATWGRDTPGDQMWQGAAQAALAASALDPESQNTLIEVLRDPELSAIPLDQLKAMAQQDPGFDERDWAEFVRLYQLLR